MNPIANWQRAVEGVCACRAVLGSSILRVAIGAQPVVARGGRYPLDRVWRKRP